MVWVAADGWQPDSAAFRRLLCAGVYAQYLPQRRSYVFCFLEPFDERGNWPAQLDGETDFSASAIGCILVLGVFQLGLGYILFTKGLEQTQPVSASLISTIEPILNPILVAVFYGEKITPLAILGAVIVICAVVVYNVVKTNLAQKPCRLKRKKAGRRD